MKQKHLSEKHLIAGIVISMFLWGLSWPSNKVLTNYCSVVNFTVYRYILVVSTMVLAVSILGVGFRIQKKGIPAFIVSGLLLALYSYLFFEGLKNGSPGAGGVLVTTLNPIMAYAINIFIKRKLPSGNEAAGLLLGIVAGAILLQLWKHSDTLADSGNLYFLLAALTWAVMSKFTAKGAQYGSSITFSLWQYLVTLLCLLPLTNFAEMRAAIHITDAAFWLNLFFGSAIVTTMATTVYFYTTTRLGAEKASSFIFLVPLAAAVSSFMLLGEKIHLHTAAGGALGMIAVYFINKRKPVAIDIAGE
jgi:drug/metabolite transporter (DMT)-like permease